MLARVIGLLIGLWFDVGAARDLDATLQLRVKMLGRGVPLRLRVSDGRCVVTPGPAPEAGAQVAIGLADLIRVAFGLLGWPSLLSSGRLELSGFTAWLVWLVAHIYFLINFRNRLVVMIDWAWAYWTYQRYARIIMRGVKNGP